MFGQAEPEVANKTQGQAPLGPSDANYGQLGGQGNQPGYVPASPDYQSANAPQPMQNRRRNMLNGVDLDDPQQNPAYGHWDPYAVLSFIMALFLPIPLIPAFMGGIAIYRIRKLHMKGMGFAVAAVVISLLSSFMMLWLAFAGLSVDEFYQLLMQNLPNGLDGGTDQISA